jgi:uncharacterized protein YceH (UPF0502 family)
MILLSQEQCRVIGVMLEKETTTPEQYPLSLNAITVACNQKSNREPVTSFSDSEVQNVIDELVESNQLMIDHKASARVNKYFHRFCNTEFGNLTFTAQQRAIICVLLLRGPQTPGELRTRTNRLADFTDVSNVEATLIQLQNLNGKALVKKLEREPGKRESRYVHLLSETNDIDLLESSVESSIESEVELSVKSGVEAESSGIQKDKATGIHEAQLAERVEELEKQVAALTEQVTCLTQLFDEN